MPTPISQRILFAAAAAIERQVHLTLCRSDRNRVQSSSQPLEIKSNNKGNKVISITLDVFQ